MMRIPIERDFHFFQISVLETFPIEITRVSTHDFKSEKA
jgi:hypothetical protein